MSIKRILVTGASGFVGSSLMRHLTGLGYEVMGIDTTYKGQIVACDVSNESEFSLLLGRIKPDIIVHCAARKNLPDCEENKAAAFATNSLSTETIAAYAKEAHAKVIYLSSDVVFDGQQGNYVPTDSMRPINWYGKTKTFSEIILRTVDNVAICRTALVIGELNDEYQELLNTELKNDVLINQTLLPQYVYRRLRDSKTVRLPATIISNPTPVELLCEIISRIIEQDARGVFHATGPDALSRRDTGLLIAKIFDFDEQLVIEDDANISSLRPCDISMNSSETFKQLAIDPTAWQLSNYLANRGLYE
jgi:dTDP-4-dehydrorhamnose reductase